MSLSIVLAFDSFKGSLSAADACELARTAILATSPDAHVVLKPMADGGEGTADAMMRSLDGVWIPATVTGPLPGQRVASGFAWFPERRLALVEMASASGLTLLADHERNPCLTTTSGTGELIRAALQRTPRDILLAVGGSATVDGGFGAATALGWNFLDTENHPVAPSGGALRRVARIIPPGQPFPCRMRVLCDVTNPLTGLNGAANVFGPQKGADPAMVDRLEAGLVHWARLIREQLGRDIERIPGAGAAGGLAAGALAFMGAELVSGIQTVMDACNLPGALRQADWVITGEGRLDEQSLQGKVISGVLESARAANIKTAVLAGEVKGDGQFWKKAGVHCVAQLRPEGMPVAESMTRVRELLPAAVQQLLRDIQARP